MTLTSDLTTKNNLPALTHHAMVTMTKAQKLIVAAAVVVVVAAALIEGLRSASVAFVAALSALYFIDLCFSAFVVTSAVLRRNRPSTVYLDFDLPSYSILCPMFREARVLPYFVDAMLRLQYPTDRLQIIIILEEEDDETIFAVRRLDLPAHFTTVIVPPSHPQTKPKACNYALQHVVTGECVVIYDAEDKPEPDQLIKAAAAFVSAPAQLACLQAPLNFYNIRQNILTRLFTAEYSLWFDLVLVGLQRLDGPIPLGGTSNHFRTDVLRNLGGWDSYNVTEDCDLGIRLYKQGFRTGMLDSTTYEEANSQVRNWLRQRSRWVKGYIQTFLVHTRGGWKVGRRFDPQFFTFLLVVGGKAAVNFINPLMWVLTISYFAFRPALGHDIQTLFPPVVFYIAITTLLLGNMLFLYMFLLGSAKRGNFDLVKYGLLAPLYWLLMSVASCYALGQLIRRPHYWEKTVHGLHLPAEHRERG
jgi:cellulose synthase/poly-beta-1,6-N-acetylglucosamine synthase-like glycosyltransferase